MRKLAGLGLAAAALLAGAFALVPGAGAAVSGPAFYIDGVVYRTVGTPTDLTGTGAPAHSYDAIYDLGGIQLNVAGAAPGDRDFNGGRWMVHGITFVSGGYAAALASSAVDSNGNDVLDSEEEVLAAIGAGYAVDSGIVKSFECPVIKVPASSR